MKSSDIQTVVYEFLDLVENGRGMEEECLTALELSLDRLALARHYVRYEFESGHPHPTRKQYSEIRALAAQQFPTLGLYNVALDVAINLAETELAVGDAIDDIADIALDLYDVAWCWRNTSEADALWHFEHGYMSHWGEHLRHLQLYLESHKRHT